MKDSSKIKMLYGLVAILVIINAGVIGFIFTHRPPRGFPAERVIHELQFSKEQTKEFEKLKGEHHDALAKVHEQSRALHDLLFAQLSTGATDHSIADSAINAIGENTKIDESITYNHLAQLRKICSPEQQKKFDEMNRACYETKWPKTTEIIN
jgi:hypothetical protein